MDDSTIFFKRLLKLGTGRAWPSQRNLFSKTGNLAVDIFVIVIFLVDTPFGPNPVDSKTPPSPCNPTVR